MAIDLNIEEPVELQFPQYKELDSSLREYASEEDADTVRRAFRYAFRAHDGQKRLSGEPYIIHPLAVATTLAEHKQDIATVSAGLLHDVVEDTEVSHEDLGAAFGEEVAALVEGVTKISALKGKSHETNVAENIRKMLLATTQDVRVMIIKLADKRHNMMTLGFQKPEKVKRIATETLEIYAQIAGRLGMYKFKSELEDLAFASLQPDIYQEIQQFQKKHQNDDDAFVRDAAARISAALEAENIDSTISGRTKHVYSIYQKMIREGKGFGEIYDLHGLRMITDTITDCYSILGIIHTLWKPVPGRFKDYIAMPKQNMYQSLHTSVLHDDGKPLEVQIRTRQMHRTAEEGIAAHWMYKQGSGIRQNINWLKKISQVQGDLPEPTEFMEHLRQDLTPDEISVFTPRGDIIHLPDGATVLDFAFRIHTQVGLTCVGARIDGKMVPIRSLLKSGDQIEIQTRKDATPSPTWLRYVKTPLARNKIRQHLKKKEEEAREKFAQPEAKIEETQLQPNLFQKVVSKIAPGRPKEQDAGRLGIEVAGMSDIKVVLAQCCAPIYGEPIIGFITKGRGVSIHSIDCNVLPNKDEYADRYIDVRWKGVDKLTSVVIEVNAEDKQGIYLKMVQCISGAEINMTEASASRSDDRILAKFTMDIDHVDSLNEIMENLDELPEVIEVNRLR